MKVLLITLIFSTCLLSINGYSVQYDEIKNHNMRLFEEELIELVKSCMREDSSLDMNLLVEKSFNALTSSLEFIGSSRMNRISEENPTSSDYVHDRIEHMCKNLCSMGQVIGRPCNCLPPIFG